MMKTVRGEKWVGSRGKRVEDLSIAISAIPVGFTLTTLGAISIALFDRVNPGYRQQRTGRNNVPFNILKIKTMPHCKEDTPSGGNHDDPRASQMGRILRKLRIDELPQIANVIVGNMSMVGPRPLPESEFAIAREVLGEKEYSDWQTIRHLGRPGIVDPYSVDYFREGLPLTYRKQDFEITIPRRVELETQYMLETASLENDLQILAQAAMIVGSSALRPLISL